MIHLRSALSTLALFMWLLEVNLHVCIAQQSNPMEKNIESFSVAGVTPLEALLKLGAQGQVPLGIICSDNALLSTQLTINQSHTSVQSILAVILDGVISYRAKLDKNGVVQIFDPTKISGNAVLNFSFPRFQSFRSEDTTDISERMWGDFQMKINPKRTGYGGVLRVPPGDHKLPPIDLVDAKIGDILDWMVVHHGSMAWIMWPQPVELVDTPQYRLWNLVYYPSSLEQSSKLCCIYIPKDMIGVSDEVQKRLSQQ